MTRVLLRLGALAFLGAVAAGLRSTWDRLPARHAIRWGPGGADRWVDLSTRSVGAPLATGLVGVSGIGLLRRAVLFGLSAVPRQGPGLVVGVAGPGIDPRHRRSW